MTPSSRRGSSPCPPGSQLAVPLTCGAKLQGVLLVESADDILEELPGFAARRKEIAARFVLGASRTDVIRQLLAGLPALG